MTKKKIWGTGALQRRVRIAKKREREAWFCQICGKKYYKNEPKFYIGEECLKKLKKEGDK